MFFKQIRRNAAKNRKGNGLFFGSLVIAIVAFYTLLSLGEQDVMRYLANVESDAVQRLLGMLPVVYMVSLFFVFFLVYFACKYQVGARHREFGLYLMLGMKQSRLFLMLFAETLWNSLISLLIGLPVALLLTEGVSLTTANLVGLGILGHRFTLSATALIWTVCGYIIVQLTSMLFISIPLSRMEPAHLLDDSMEDYQGSRTALKQRRDFALGIILLLSAYALGMLPPASLVNYTVPLILLLGALGTFRFYRGLGGYIEGRIHKRAARAKGLQAFTNRQVQWNVLRQHKTLALTSLMLLTAMSCFSYGITMGLSRTSETRSTDFSLFGDETDVQAFLGREDVSELTGTTYPVRLSHMSAKTEVDDLVSALRAVGASTNTIDNIDGREIDYVIAESSYSNLQKAIGREEFSLEPGQVALFSSMGRDSTSLYEALDRAVKHGASVKISGKDYDFWPKLCYDNIVADRAITLFIALIVPDELFDAVARSDVPYCWNLHLDEGLVKREGLLQAISTMEEKLRPTELTYDSFLRGIGRNLFYAVSSIYLTVYMGTLFLIIANTALGLKYLIQLRRDRRRYVTLFALGADSEAICRSVRKQISIHFGLVLGLTVLSSAAAIVCLFKNMTKLPTDTSMLTVVLLAIAAVLAISLIETLYIQIVGRAASREVCTLAQVERG